MKPANAIEARQARLSFAGDLALDGVDLSVGRGELVGVIGPAGAGKSTLLKALGGLLPLDAGSIWLAGERVDELCEERRAAWRNQIGMAFQNNALFDELSVFDNVAFPLRQRRRAAKEIKERVSAKLHAVGLTAAADKLPSTLSGGMRKRVAVARAAVIQPAVGLFDEPLAGLDPETAARILAVIVQLVKGAGMAALVVSNQLPVLLPRCDRIVMLCGGRVVYDGAVAGLNGCESPVVKQFVSGSDAGPL